MMNRGDSSFFKRLALGVTASSGLAVAAAALWAGGNLPGREGGLTADLFSLLQARSPGERAEGALAQSKPRRTAPFERVLSDSRTRPAPAVPGAAPPAATPALVLADVPLVQLADAPLAGVPVETLGGVPLGVTQAPPVIFGGGSGGGTPVTGGSGGGTPGTPGTDNQPVVTPPNVNGAVPEPATWGLMLIGFGMVGSLLRRAQTLRLPRLQMTPNDAEKR